MSSGTIFVANSAHALAAARTFLFVPGNRPERFDKARASGADVVILDLEDSVAADQKDMARAAVATSLDSMGSVMVRINSASTPWFEADLEICRHQNVSAIALPRAEPGIALERAAQMRPVLAMIETAGAVLDMFAIATTHGVMRLTIGAIDLSLDLDISAPEALDPVLLQMVVTSRAAGIAAPVAGVTTQFHDPALVARDTARDRALGFTGKLCIHPAQISAARQGLRPSESEVAQAQRILAAVAQSGESAIALDGRMIDRPVIDRARRILAAAE